MGGRYGGDIRRKRGQSPAFSVKRALEVIGHETLAPFEGVGRRTRRIVRGKGPGKAKGIEA